MVLIEVPSTSLTIPFAELYYHVAILVRKDLIGKFSFTISTKLKYISLIDVALSSQLNNRTLLSQTNGVFPNTKVDNVGIFLKLLMVRHWKQLRIKSVSMQIYNCHGALN